MDIDYGVVHSRDRFCVIIGVAAGKMAVATILYLFLRNKEIMIKPNSRGERLGSGVG